MRTKDGRRHSGTAVRRGQDVPHGAGRGILAFIAAAAGTLALLLAGLAPPAHAQGATDPALDKEICLGCHGQKGYSAKGPDGKPQSLHVTPERFGGSVHGKRQCVECHRNIDEIPHKPGTEVRVSCVQCHEDLWEQARREGKTAERARLGVVVTQIERYMKSVHARPSREDQSRTNATCYNCHDAHYVYASGSEGRQQWRLNLPNTCGKCHEGAVFQYQTSVHGKAVLEDKNPYAAVCSDCHTTHDVANPFLDSTRLVITRNCGNCHQDSRRTYMGTYHGQVVTLGYANTAKCFDCHGSHGIQRVSSPASSVHEDNRLKTCQQCHKDASKGFVSFLPHGNTSDFERYPILWMASKFMIGLLAGTFAFFWTHSALWFYREYRERQQRKGRPHVQVSDLPQPLRGRYYRRFGPIWRLAHLVFALSLMILTLTGMTLFYAESAWAPAVSMAMGGPQVTGLIHRVFAVIFAFIFIAQLLWFVVKLAPQWRTFNWFGPTSLVPWIQDGKDAIAMFTWFFGKGPRPVFDRWTYWEKFDYWAPFWGVTIIGVSGFMLWFPSEFGAFLPGWVFNVATIFHGEEAFLAAVFLFTVHFFNNHFRPDKFPLDIVMFTGAVPLELFRHEHRLEYDRLVASGTLANHLVEAPAQPMTLGSKILGFTLIACGLALLALVLAGFFTTTPA